MWAVSSCMSLLFVASADQLFQDGWTVPLNVAFLIAEEAGWNEVLRTIKFHLYGHSSDLLT